MTNSWDTGIFIRGNYKMNSEVINKLKENIGKVIVGKEETVKLILVALFADGHVLMEDVPGTGKTRLAKALASSINADFSRIQFTPDLLPSDMTGINVYNRAEEKFELKKGPVFANILLADEINRATPRTQAGLLECMEERQVTIDGETLKLPELFFCIATQNPVETSGTFPLPEAQLDRFIMRLSMGLPTKEEEVRILDTYMNDDPLKELKAVAEISDITAIKKEIEGIYVHDAIKDYIVKTTESTRNSAKAVLGVSPRGTLAFMKAAKALAYIEGRSFVTPDDIKTLAVPVLSHRVIINFGYTKKSEAEAFIENILAEIPVPTEDVSK